MSFIADLHVHSKYSRATSRDMSPESIWKWAQIKGISVIGTGDFTHPGWFRELMEKLEPAGGSLFRLRQGFRDGGVPHACRADVLFMLTAEISCIYSKGGRTRKVHALLAVPDTATVTRINLALARIGNLNADGRPILGLDAKDLLNICLAASPETLFVPAHAWTPHFSVFGAMSGFDSLDECFEDLTPHIHAIETGLSSDPPMNWRLSSLDGVTLVSNSDAHSASKIGREANVFDTAFSFQAIREAIITRRGFLGTIEFFPEEGKYHYDGHRSCEVSLAPAETVRHNYLCPVCGKGVTVGVMHRVEKLADRAEGFRPPGAAPFRSVIPLPELIAETLGVGPGTKAVERLYGDLIGTLGNEFKILLDVPVREIGLASSDRLADAVALMRQGKVHIDPGFDGRYGKIRIFEAVERAGIKGQTLLF